MFRKLTNNDSKNKEHIYLPFDKLKKIVIGDKLEPLLEKIDDLKFLSNEQLTSLQNIRYAIMGNQSLVNLVLLEKIFQKRNFND